MMFGAERRVGRPFLHHFELGVEVARSARTSARLATQSRNCAVKSHKSDKVTMLQRYTS